MTWIFIFLSGLLMSVAHPIKYENFSIPNSWFTILVATIGLCLFLSRTLSEANPRRRFLKAWFGSLIYFVITIFWISVALHTFGDINLFISILACVLLSAYCAVFSGVWALIAGSEAVRHRPFFLKILAWASLWTFCEAVRQYFLTGFGWGELGFAFYFAPWLAKTAAFWGVHGLTFLWVFIAALLIHFKLFFPTFSRNRENLKPAFIALGIWIVVGSIGTYFSLRLIKADLKLTKISIVQPNIAQEIKWNPDSSEQNLKTLIELTLEAAKQSPAIIVWPETSFPYLIRAPQKQMPVLTTTPIVIGAVIRENQVNRNSAILVENDQITSRFDKIHLVPFGEFVPLKNWLPFGKLVANAGDFLSGAIDQPLLQPTNSILKMGSLICYEDTFSRESVRHAKKGANLLVNLTNDAWYGDTSAQLQHAAMAQFQVFQTGLPMIRSTNDGVSTFLSLNEREDLPSFHKQTLTRELPISQNPQQTFFVWTYPLMEWIWLAIFVIAILWKETFHQKLKRRKIFFSN